MEIFVLTSHAKDVWVASHEGVGKRYGEESVCVLEELVPSLPRDSHALSGASAPPDSVCMQVLTS